MLFKGYLHLKTRDLVVKTYKILWRKVFGAGGSMRKRSDGTQSDGAPNLKLPRPMARELRAAQVTASVLCSPLT